jgi:diguanylate cyclase
MGCAVNVSASLLMNSAFTDRAISIIECGGVDPQLLTIELTETAAVASFERADQNFKRLKAIGARLSIDDYGTGQSTLSYLQKFDADEIKIDQSFVKSIAINDANRIMVKSTIDMAKELGIAVVAEGVEDQVAFDTVAALGCGYIQGWFVGKPIPGAQFLDTWCVPKSSDEPMQRRVVV